MAVIKINRSQGRIVATPTPKVGALSLDMNLAIMQGQAISKLGKVVEDANAKRRKEQEELDFRQMEPELLKKVLEAKTKYSKSTNIADVNSFLQEADPKNFTSLTTGKSKGVQNKVKNFLYDQRTKQFGKLYTTITSNHAKELLDGDDQLIIDLEKEEASNDPIARKLAKQKKGLLFNSPEYIQRHGIKKARENKNKSELSVFEKQLILKTKNEATDIINDGARITKVLGDKKARYYIDRAKQSLVSQELKKDTDALKREEQDNEQKISNFTHLLTGVKNKDTDIDLDSVNDFYKAGRINSGQRDVLYQALTGSLVLSDTTTLDIINYQIQTAETQSDIDALRNTITLDNDIVSKLGIEDIDAFSILFKKLQKDLPAFKEYQTIRKGLSSDLGSLKEAGGLRLFSAGDKTDQRLIINGLASYDKFVADGDDPRDAYIKVANNFLNDDKKLPNIYEVTPLQTLKAPEPTKPQTENPDSYFNDLRKSLSEKYKTKEIDIQTFASEISSVDRMEDIFTIRKKILGTNNKAFAKENNKTNFQSQQPE